MTLRIVFFLGLFTWIGTSLEVSAQVRSTDSKTLLVKEIVDQADDKNNPVTPKRIVLPLSNGMVCYQNTVKTDSLLGADVLYKASQLWYSHNFPFGKRDLLLNDPLHGRLLAGCTSRFKYVWKMNELTMKFNFTVEIAVRYGQCEMKISNIRPFDEVKGEETFAGNISSSAWEARNLERMYETYGQTALPPGFMSDKLHGLDFYFRHLIASYQTDMRKLSGYMSGRNLE